MLKRLFRQNLTTVNVGDWDVWLAITNFERERLGEPPLDEPIYAEIKRFLKRPVIVAEAVERYRAVYPDHRSRFVGVLQLRARLAQIWRVRSRQDLSRGTR